MFASLATTAISSPSRTDDFRLTPAIAYLASGGSSHVHTWDMEGKSRKLETLRPHPAVSELFFHVIRPTDQSHLRYNRTTELMIPTPIPLGGCDRRG
jgi:hypothetical protein